MRKYLLLGFLFLLLGLVLGFQGLTYGEDKPLMIYESELSQLIQHSQNLKEQLQNCQTNYQALQLELTNLLQKSEELSKQAEISGSQLIMLQSNQIELKESWNKYREGSEKQIRDLETQRNVGIGIGISGVIGGIIIALLL